MTTSLARVVFMDVLSIAVVGSVRQVVPPRSDEFVV